MTSEHFQWEKWLICAEEGSQQQFSQVPPQHGRVPAQKRIVWGEMKTKQWLNTHTHNCSAEWNTNSIFSMVRMLYWAETVVGFMLAGNGLHKTMKCQELRQALIKITNLNKKL